MSTRTRTAAALAALVAAGLTPFTLPSAPASAATAKYGDDFNGLRHVNFTD